MQPAPDPLERQEIVAATVDVLGEKALAARIEVGGHLLGCLGTGELLGQSADALCMQHTGFPATETAAELELLLEGPYGPSAVEVTGGPAASAPLHVVTQWGVPPISVLPVELAPGFSVGTAFTRFASQGSGRLAFSLTNIGSAAVDATADPVEIEADLPDGALAYGISNESAGLAAGSLRCDLPSSTRLACEFGGELPPFQVIEVEVLVVLDEGPPAVLPGAVSVSGGNAPSDSISYDLERSDEPVPFGTRSFSLRPEEEGGAPARQAGSHPFQVTSSIVFNQDGDAMPAAFPKDLRLRLPPGLLAGAAQLPLCSMADFVALRCPSSSALGAGALTFSQPGAGVLTKAAPIFNLAPGPGEPARFGLPVPVSEELGLGAPIVLLGSIDATPGTATLTIPSITQSAGLVATTLALWGVPGDPRHDSVRGSGCLTPAESVEPCRALSDPDPRALLTLPTSCASEHAATLELIPWNPPAVPVSVPSQPFAVVGCNRLPFQPQLSASPTTRAAGSPSGLDVELDLDGSGVLEPSSLASAQVEEAAAVLPEGLTLNPALAGGLAACSLAELSRESFDSAPGEGCPEAAKIGTAEVVSPLFPDPIAGAVYAAAPSENRAGDARFALYAIFRDRDRGLFLVLPLRVDADPTSGRLTATFTDLPPMPLERLSLRFNDAARAPLTAPDCGLYEVSAALTPSSVSIPKPLAATFAIDRDCEGPGFAPALMAGTVSHAGGRTSPLVIQVSSSAHGPNLSGLDLTMPPGLVADFTAATVCPEEVVASAACPGSSRLGYARIALGTGPTPLWVPAGDPADSDVYLAGPYRGAPYSFLVHIPAVVGPFDLGQVVLRAPIRIDPATAQASASFQQLPQIHSGIPLRYREIRLVLDRPGFVRNPTSCERAAIHGIARAVDGTTTPVSWPFQAADCAALPFRPRLAIRLSDALARNGHPALEVVLRGGDGEAAIASAAFTLPADQLLDLRRIGAVCARHLVANQCPPRSRLGHARLWSPLVDAPLEGPIYLREPARRLPDLLVDLRRAGLHILLHAHAETPRNSLRIRFAALPDLPLSRAVFRLAGGRRGIFVNSQDLCGRMRRVHAALGAHSGARRHARPRLRLRGRCRSRGPSGDDGGPSGRVSSGKDVGGRGLRSGFLKSF